MIITSVDVWILGNLKRQKPIVIRINTDSDGLYGYGEAGIAYGAGHTAAFGMVQDLAPLIIGKDPMNNEKIWEDLYQETFWLKAGGPITFAALSAIDVALMDIKGKYFQTPIYNLLGGKQNDRLRTYASQLQTGWLGNIGRQATTEEYVNICKLAMSQGYTAIKIDFSSYTPARQRFARQGFQGLIPYENLQLIEERISAIRSACGNALDIIVENHCRTDLSSAIQIGKICEKYNVFFYEEAVGPMKPSIQRELREKCNVPLAAGERIFGRWGFANFFEQNSIQVIQPDICTCGGLTEAKKIADMAHVYDVKVQAHVAGSPISLAAALQFEAAIPNFCIHEHHTVNVMDDVRGCCKYDYQPVDGYFTVPDLPGLGQELTQESIDKALATAHIR